jgi:hypothetical protein
MSNGAAAEPAPSLLPSPPGAGVALAEGSGLSVTEEITATYQWLWGHDLSPGKQRALGDHSVRFAADPPDGVLDEFRISDVPRLGSSLACGRILVADTGNERVVTVRGALPSPARLWPPLVARNP